MSEEFEELDITFEQWFRYGLKKSFCGPPICVEHDGYPTTEEEDQWWEHHGESPCFSMVRLYADELERLLVEQHHSPSLWRRSGWE